MASPRRMGSEHSQTRSLLLDATERLMLAEGHAAVGIRRVAREAGVAPALVLYYFRTLDDLFLAALRRRAEGELERLEASLGSPDLFRRLYTLNGQSKGAKLIMEFVTMAQHRDAIRGEMAQYAERFRRRQLDALLRRGKDYRIEGEDIPPAALLVLLTGISRTLVQEEALGMTLGHAETLALVERCLRRFEHGEDIER